MIRPGNILLVGPLSQADEKIRELGMNLFTSLMMMESMERLEAAEQEYLIACDGDDPAEMREKELKLRACESTFQITAAMLDVEDGSVISD